MILVSVKRRTRSYSDKCLPWTRFYRVVYDVSALLDKLEMTFVIDTDQPTALRES